MGENHLGVEGQGAEAEWEAEGEVEGYEKTKKEHACCKPRELQAPERGREGEGERESFMRPFP
jgi:hypothetical protein